MTDAGLSREQLVTELAIARAERDTALARVEFLRAALDAVPACPHGDAAREVARLMQDRARDRAEITRLKGRLRAACAYVDYPDILLFRGDGCVPAQGVPDA